MLRKHYIRGLILKDDEISVDTYICCQCFRICRK